MKFDISNFFLNGCILLGFCWYDRLAILVKDYIRKKKSKKKGLIGYNVNKFD